MNELSVAAQNLRGSWYQGDYTDDNGNYCGIGHLCRAHGMTDRDIYDDELSEKLLSQLEILNAVAIEQYSDRIATKHSDRSFPDFNDHLDTTEDEAIAVLEKAAVLWDERIDK
jgi:hypothetical protein